MSYNSCIAQVGLPCERNYGLMFTFLGPIAVNFFFSFSSFFNNRALGSGSFFPVIQLRSGRLVQLHVLNILPRYSSPSDKYVNTSA